MSESILAKRIKFYRVLADMTQEELADKVGKSRVTINHYESGYVDPPSPIVNEVAKALKVPVYKLYTEDVDKEIDRVATEKMLNYHDRQRNVYDQEILTKLDAIEQKLDDLSKKLS